MNSFEQTISKMCPDADSFAFIAMPSDGVGVAAIQGDIKAIAPLFDTLFLALKEAISLETTQSILKRLEWVINNKTLAETQRQFNN